MHISTMMIRSERVKKGEGNEIFVKQLGKLLKGEKLPTFAVH